MWAFSQTARAYGPNPSNFDTRNTCRACITPLVLQTHKGLHRAQLCSDIRHSNGRGTVLTHRDTDLIWEKPSSSPLMVIKGMSEQLLG